MGEPKLYEKQMVVIYMHPHDFSTLCAAAEAERISIFDFMVLAAWKEALKLRDSELPRFTRF